MTRSLDGSGILRYLVARLQKRSRLSAVRKSVIHETSVIEPGSQIVQVEMDRHSYCGYECSIINAHIGSFCSIADQVFIGGSAHPLEYVSTSPVFLNHRDSVKAKFAHHEFLKLPRTEIGNDVWIGHGARIKAGITIGHGAVVGMGAVVTKEVRPYAIVAGNPAREVRRRFEDRIVEALLRSAWWTFDDDRLREAAKLFTNPEAFLESEALL